jgi:hypothetical protein
MELSKIWTPDSELKMHEFVRLCREKFTGLKKFRVTFDVYSYEQGERWSYVKTGEQVVSDERLGITSGNMVIKMVKNSTKYGRYIDECTEYRKKYEVAKIEALVPKQKDRSVTFNKKLDKILGYLQKYNLWTGIQMEIKFIKVIGLELAVELYQKRWNSNYYAMDRQEQVDNDIAQYTADYIKVRNILIEHGDEELFNWYESVANKGNVIDDEYISHIRLAIQDFFKKHKGTIIYTPYITVDDLECLRNGEIKTMRFYPYRKYCNYTQNNQERLNAIGEAMTNKVKYRTTGDNGYDVTFNYNPDEQKAWYSEEYRNCGNGHYYLALDNEHAIYYEKD